MKVRALILASVCVLGASIAPVAAQNASAVQTAPLHSTADEYVAAVRQNVVFLAEASRLAEQRSASDKVKAFARREASDEQRVADNLKFWETERGLSAFAPSMLMASNDVETITETADAIMTGRSVAVDPNAASEWTRPESGVAMVSPGVLVIPQLTRLEGDAFDALYKKTQSIALQELAGFYEAYSLTGKDATLKAIALRQLPIVKQRLADLDTL